MESHSIIVSLAWAVMRVSVGGGGGQLAANQLAHGSVIVINTVVCNRPFLTNVRCLCSFFEHLTHFAVQAPFRPANEHVWGTVAATLG